jgi:hypothetical protein
VQLQPSSLGLSLLDNLLHLLAPLVAQRHKHPEPGRHLDKAPGEDNAVVQGVAGAHHVVRVAGRHDAAGLERVRVGGQGEEEEQADRRLGAPVLVRELLVHGDGGEVGQAEEGEEDGEEGDGRRGGLELAGRWLRRWQLAGRAQRASRKEGSADQLHRLAQQQDHALVGDDLGAPEQHDGERHVEQRDAADHGRGRDDGHGCGRCCRWSRCTCCTRFTWVLLNFKAAPGAAWRAGRDVAWHFGRETI